MILEIVSFFDGVVSFDNVMNDSRARPLSQMFERLSIRVKRRVENFKSAKEGE